MRRIFTIALSVMLSTALLSVAALGQTTYTWNQTSAGVFGTAANWTPTRTTPATNDVLVIDGSVTPVTIITGLASQTIGQLKVTNNAFATLNATSAATLTISGGTGTDFQIDAGSTLVDSASSAIIITLPTGTTGTVSGTYRSRSIAGGAATIHQLTAADASGLTFTGGSICVQDTNSTGNIFGGSSAVANSVVFQSGSQFIQRAGANPFARSQPSSVVVFNHGSWFRFGIASGTPAFSGRTYPNLEWNAVLGTGFTPSGGSAVSLDTLAVTQDSLKMGMTATPGHSIKGNILVAPGAVLIFNPASAGTMNLNGTLAQTIANSGTLTTLANQNITVNNSNGITLNGNATFNGTLAFTLGKLTVASGTLALGSTGVVSGTGAGKFIDGKVSRLITTTGKFGWPIGQNADYLPDSVYTSLVTKGGSLTLQMLDKTVTPPAGTIYGTAPILKRYLRSSVDTLNVTPDSVGISFATADLPAGVFASNLQVARWNGPAWVNAAVSRVDSTNNIVYVKTNLGTGDYVITAQSGFLVSSRLSINYGTVPAGQTKKDSVVITNTGNAALSIDSVTSTLGDFTITPTTLSLPAGGTSKFYVTYAPVTGGTKNATVVFYHGGINGRDSVSVTGGASLITYFAATPDSLDFGTKIRNSSTIDTIVVANSGNVSLVIDSVKSPDPSFTVSPSKAITILGGGNGKFFITYKPLNGGAKLAKIVFYSNSSTQPDTVYVKGDVVIAPIFSASKTSVNYGAVLLGEQGKDSVTVTNTGTASLSITTVTSTDPLFVVTPTSATLAIDATQKFYITFTPTAIGTKTASIVATSNVTEIRDTIKVAGIGSNIASIAEARKDANGDLVPDHSITKDTLVITGVITSPNMGASAGRTSYFIQDATGGIEVDKYGPPPATYQRGDSVMVVGIVGQFNGLDEFAPLVLDSLHFQILKRNATLPKPKHLTFSEYLSNAESYESQLIEIDTLYKKSGTWPGAGVGNVSIYVTNTAGKDSAQMFLDLDAGIGGFPEPAYPINVVGVLSQYTTAVPPNKGYEISPRDSADITNTKLAQFVKISEARKDLNADGIPDHSVTKDTIMIAGTITSPNLQTANTAYFVQDSTGGVEIFQYGLGQTFVVGDSVSVVGTVAQFHGLTEFSPLVLDSLHFTLLKHHAVVPKAKLITLHQYVTNAESYEGMLIQIDTLWKASGTWPGAAAGASIYVTNRSHADTAQMYINASTDIGGSAEPLYPINLVCIGAQYSSGAAVTTGGYEILPRDTSDFVHIVVVKVNEEYAGIPATFMLENNYPNPFNPSTTILYGIAQQSQVTVKVYSVLGQEMATLVNDIQSPSYYRVVWNGKDLNGKSASSGVYFFRIIANPVDGKTQPFTQVKKMMMMK